MNIYNKILELENDGKVDYDVNYRGGHYGLSRSDVADLLGLGGYADYLPSKVGAFCNYLGGGLRGSITVSDYNKNLPKKYVLKVIAFTNACKKRYKEIEDGIGLNDDEDANGETNWDAWGTARSRKAGVISGY